MQGMGSEQQYVPGPAPRKGLHPVIWVLIGLFGLVLLVVLALAGTGFYIAHRFSEDPVGVATTVLGAMDADVEVLSADKSRRTLTIRERSTGKITTLNFDDLKNGSFDFGSGKREISIRSGGKDITIGGDATPDWLPSYPDAKMIGSMSTKGEEGYSGSQKFETSDRTAKVLDYYEEALKKAGLEVTRPSSTTLSGRIDGDRREVSVNVEPRNSGSHVILSYNSKD